MPVEHCIAMSFLRRLPPLFFIGFFPVVCLLWLWADSLYHTMIWTHCPASFPLVARWIITGDSEIDFGASENLAVPIGDPPTKSINSFDRYETKSLGSASTSSEPAKWFPAPRSLAEHTTTDVHGSVRRWRRSIPLWLMLACYLPPWLLPTWWQARRRRRKQEAGLPAL